MADDPSPSFLAALPSWPSGREREMNRFVGFRALFSAADAGDVRLRLTASSAYRAWLNGRLVGYGPARAAHGYYRVDEWALASLIVPGINLLAVEVAGYNVNSYYLLDQPAFLQAEVLVGDRVLVATSGPGGGFDALLLSDHVQRVQRYSVARTFSEVFRLQPGHDAWRLRPDASFTSAAVALFAPPRLLPRRVPYPAFDRFRPVAHLASGAVRAAPLPNDEVWRDWSITCIGPDLRGFQEDELEVVPSIEMQHMQAVPDALVAHPFSSPLLLDPHTFHLLDLGLNRTGFLGLRIRCDAPARLFALFDEVLVGNDIDFKRLRCVNIVAYELEPGVFEVETFEPYTFRYLKLMTREGACRIDDVYLRAYTHPDTEAAFDCSDPRLTRLFEAGRETFRQNAVDLLMDCPSRERAGWLCDSFYTARVAHDLTGTTTLERAFLENYLLAGHRPPLPRGMVPMNYPADHDNGNFIPNWALWLILQLDEYLSRSRDRALVDAFHEQVAGILHYFERFRNDDGLLERLDGWVFVEWSRANDFVQDVNYPTNMLYAAALDAAGRLYRRTDWQTEATRLRAILLRQAFDGEFFVDNAVRRPDGSLYQTTNRTEVCQYHAFHFGGATPDTHPQLWRTLVEAFGPGRRATGAFPDVHPANLLMGYTLRWELLARYGLAERLAQEMIALLLPMAEQTGTLWEHDTPTASCNHGFASHVVHVLLRDMAGIMPDATAREIRLIPPAASLTWCAACLPTPDGLLSVSRQRQHGVWRDQMALPPGYIPAR